MGTTTQPDGVNFHDFGLGNDFLGMTSKVIATIEKKKDQLGFIKSKEVRRL